MASSAKSYTPQVAQQGKDRKRLSRFGRLPACREGVLKAETFHAVLSRERQRAERSRKAFVLILLDLHAVHKKGSDESCIKRLTSAVYDATRETDIIGGVAVQKKFRTT